MTFSEFVKSKDFGNDNPYLESFIHTSLDILLEEYNNIIKKYEFVYLYDNEQWKTNIKAKSIDVAKLKFIKRFHESCEIKSITLK